MSEEKEFDFMDGVRRLNRFLDAHSANRPCPCCANEKWSLLHHNSGYTAIFGDNMMGMFLVYTRKCSNCGFMQSFSRNDVDTWCDANERE